MNVVQGPPDTLTVNGISYQIDTDYRTWIDVCARLEQIDPQDTQKMREELHSIVDQVFSRRVNAPALDILTAITDFANGYPCTGQSGRTKNSGDDTPLFSFVHDINYIILAIRNQSGIDLTYRRKEPFHFWDFLLEFQTLEEHHLISKIIALRAYDGTDREMLQKKAMFALPERISPEKAAALAEMEQQFYSC